MWGEPHTDMEATGWQRCQGALVGDNKIWATTPDVTPLDTGWRRPGKCRLRGLSEAVIISPFIFSDDRDRSTVIGGQLYEDSDKLCSTRFHIL